MVIAGLSLLFLFVFYFVKSVISTIGNFQKIESITHKKVPYKISDKKIILMNVATKRIDTLAFDKTTLINFWAFWCTPCIKEMPEFIDFKKKYPDRQILIVSFDEVETQKNVIYEKKWNYTFYRLMDSTIFEVPELFPKTIVIKNDSVLAEFYGYLISNQICLVNYGNENV